MSTSKQIADWQTDNVILWLDNEEVYYNAYISRIEKYGLFNATSAKKFVYDLWGDRTPDNFGMSRVRWREVATAMNSDIKSGLRMQTIKALNKAAGQFFFAPETMAFFNSKTYPNTRAAVNDQGVIYGTLFVTSEQQDDFHPRLFTVRLFDHETKQINTIGEFQGYTTLESALWIMRTWQYGCVPVAEIKLEEKIAVPSPTVDSLPGIDLEDELNAILDQCGFGR